MKRAKMRTVLLPQIAAQSGSTEVIRKGKASKPTEFGKMVKFQEAENQIITQYEVFEKRLKDADLLVPAECKHEEQFGCVPQLVAGDAGFYSASNEAELQEWACGKSRFRTTSRRVPNDDDIRRGDPFVEARSGEPEQKVALAYLNGATD